MSIVTSIISWIGFKQTLLPLKTVSVRLTIPNNTIYGMYKTSVYDVVTLQKEYHRFVYGSLKMVDEISDAILEEWKGEDEIR
jgi:hypothetical protein